jgi:hypothetical protein
LKRVSCPCAVLLATDREAFFPASLEKVHLDLLRARVFRMKGGHHLHMTNVEETQQAIESLYRDAGLMPVKAKL